MYLTLKAIHAASAVISITGFLARWILALSHSPMMAARWTRVLPHINDTVLLSAAVALAMMSGQYPFELDWLTAKVLLLVAYVLLGKVALSPQATGRRRVVAGLAALATAGAILATALTRLPLGFIGASG